MRGGRTIINSKPRSFNSTWKTDNTIVGSSAANQIRIPLSPSGSYNFTVYWGDGTSDNISSSLQPALTHSYASAGMYNVTMSGYIRGFQFNNAPDRLKLTNISQWGGLKLSSAGAQFFGCDRLTLNNIADTPHLYHSNVNGLTGPTLSATFRSCSLITTISRLDQWDTSKVDILSQTFYAANRFNQNIGNWNTSNATTMANLFSGPTTTLTHSFNNGGSDSIKNWDTSKVTTFSQTFLYNPNFNQPIGSWNVSSASNFGYMFYYNTAFNQPLNNWNTSNATTMISMFYEASSFNQPLSNWNTSKVVDMSTMFYQARNFNQDVGTWDVSKVTTFYFTFAIQSGTGSFNNGDSDSIKNWNISSSTTLRSMFQRQPYFNREVGLWNLTNVTDIAFMFGGGVDKAFNNANSPSIGSWNTNKIVSMSSTFIGCYSFDQNLGSWNTSNVAHMDGLFYCSGTPGIFNNGGSNAIDNWNTSKVANMSGLFRNQALFNQPVNSWNTSKVVDMSNVFYSATGFNQPLSNWNVSSSTTVANFMFGKTFNDYSTANYDALLIGWASRPVKPNLSTNFGTIQYTAAASASRAVLTSAPNNWTIVDGGQV